MAKSIWISTNFFLELTYKYIISKIKNDLREIYKEFDLNLKINRAISEYVTVMYPIPCNKCFLFGKNGVPDLESRYSPDSGASFYLYIYNIISIFKIIRIRKNFVICYIKQNLKSKFINNF